MRLDAQRLAQRLALGSAWMRLDALWGAGMRLGSLDAQGARGFAGGRRQRPGFGVLAGTIQMRVVVFIG